MGLGSLLFKQGALLNISREQRSDQAQPTSAVGDFVSRYLKCLGVDDLGKAPEALKERGINEDAIKCLGELMRSASWDELFTKINMEAALFEAVAKHELQRLMGSGNSANPASLALPAYYSFVLSIAIIRQLLNNEGARPMGLMTLVKMTYLIFDIYGELTKRGIIPRDLEIEVWRTRETLIKIMEELFKGNRTITVDGKSFDANKQLR